MLSQTAVQAIAEEFVTVKIDPNNSRDALHHKTTGYVPELVVLDSRQNFIDSIEARDAPGVARALKQALADARKRR